MAETAEKDITMQHWRSLQGTERSWLSFSSVWGYIPDQTPHSLCPPRNSKTAPFATELPIRATIRRRCTPGFTRCFCETISIPTETRVKPSKNTYNYAIERDKHEKRMFSYSKRSGVLCVPRVKGASFSIQGEQRRNVKLWHFHVQKACISILWWHWEGFQEEKSVGHGSQ